MKKKDSISFQTLSRLPMYYSYIESLHKEGMASVSSATIAKRFFLNEVQVRKDLASVSAIPGRPRTGFEITALLKDIAACLGYDNISDVILVGVGSLGRAILSYTGFEESGVRLVAGFDNDEAVIGRTLEGKTIFSIDKLPSFCKRMNIHMGIIAVTANQAQNVCDIMVESGILSILNFAPVHLIAPKDIYIKNENIALSLAMLSQGLADRFKTT